MSQKNKKRFIFGVIAGFGISFLLLTAAVFFVSDAAFAQVEIDPEYGTTFGLGTADLMSTVIKIVQWALGFLGLIAVIMIMYGGFVWMTAAGNTDKVDKAKKIIIRAVIGLVIVLLAWAITLFIMRTMSDVTDGGGQLCDPGPPREIRSDGCADCNDSGTGWNYHSEWPGCGFGVDTFRLGWVDPDKDETGVVLCSVIQASFNGDILPSSVPGHASLYVHVIAGGAAGDNCSVNGHRDCASGVCDIDGTDTCQGDEVPGIWMFGGNNPDLPAHCFNFATDGDETGVDCGCAAPPCDCVEDCNNINPQLLMFAPASDYLEITKYRVELTSDIAEDAAAPRNFAGETWYFTTGNETLEIPPYVQAVNPADEAVDVCLKPPIQSFFSSKMMVASLNPNTVKLNDGAVDVALRSPFGYPPNKQSFTTNPVDVLTAGILHTATLIAGDPASKDPNNGIMDVCWNHLDGNEDGSSDGTLGGDDFMTISTATIPTPPPWDFTTDTDTTNVDCTPEISGINPSNGKYDDTAPNVQILGGNFGIAGGWIYFNNEVDNVNTCFDAGGYPNQNCDVVPWGGNTIDIHVPGGPPAWKGYIPSAGAKDGQVIIDLDGNLATPDDQSNGVAFDVTSPQIDRADGLNTQPHGGEGQYVVLRKRSDSNADFGTYVDGVSKVYFRKINTAPIGAEVEAEFPPDPCPVTWLENHIVIKVPDLNALFGINACAGGWLNCVEVNSESEVGIQVLLGDGVTRSNITKFIYTDEDPGPGLCDIQPNACGTNNDSRSLLGENFGTAGGNVDFTFPGPPLVNYPAVINNWDDANNQIDVTVPNIDNSDIDYEVSVVNALGRSPPLPFTVPCGGVPKVVEDPSCDTHCDGGINDGNACTDSSECPGGACIIGMASPNPYKNSVDVCTNAIMGARFTAFMAAATFNDTNITLEDCGAAADCSGAAPYAAGITVTPFPFPTDGFTLTPNAGLSIDNYYRVTISKDVTSGVPDPNPGTKMNSDYVWVFKTKSDPAPCPVENVMVTPPNAQLILIPDTQGYSAIPTGPNCTLVNPGDYIWAWTSSNPGVATVTSSATNAETATSVAKGSTYIKAEAEGKSGQGLLKVDPDSCAFDPNRCADPIPGGVEECPGSFCDVIADRCMPVMTDWDGDGFNFTPPSGPPGTTLSVEGCWFGNNPGSIDIGGLSGDLTTCANSWSNNLIVATTDATTLATGAYHLINIKTEAGRCNGGANNGKLCTVPDDCGGSPCISFSTSALPNPGQVAGLPGNPYEFFATVNCARLCDAGSDNAYAYCTGDPDCIGGNCSAGAVPPGAGVPGLCPPLQPNTGKEGTQISIDGLNFVPIVPHSSRVYYPVGLADTYMDVIIRSGVPAWDQTIIFPTVVPVGAESGGVNVQVNNCPSNALPFGISCSNHSDCATNCCKFDGAVGAKICKPFAECSPGTPGTPCQLPANALNNGTCDAPAPLVAAGGDYRCIDSVGHLDPVPPPTESYPPAGVDDCTVCCDPDINNNDVLGEAGDQQVSATGLECTADVGNCDTNERGLYCGCTSDDQCQSPPTTIGCGINDGRADHCCYARPNISDTTPTNGLPNICRNALVAALFDTRMDPTSFKTGRRPVSDDAIGVWHLDEGSDVIAGNSSGSNYHGTLMNGTTWSSGRYDNGILFDGVDDHIVVDDPTFPDPGMDSYSISFWLKRPVGSKDDKIVSKGWDDGAAQTTGWWFRTNDGDKKLYLSVGDGTTYKTAIEGVAMNDDKWHHYVGVIERNDGMIYLYRDGALQPVAASNNISTLGSIEAPTHNLLFGRGADEFNSPVGLSFDGKIDEVRVYDDAKTQTEVADNYQAMVGNFEMYDNVTNDPIPMNVSFFTNNTVAAGLPSDVFESNQTVRAVIKGLPLGGVLSAEGVGMTNVNYNFDGIGGDDSYSWTFTTSDIICEIDHLDFIWEKPVGTGNDPPSLFTCAVDGCDDGDAFVGEPGNQQSWSVIAQDVNNTLLAGNIDFTWTESDPKNIYTPTHDAGDTTQGCPNLSTDLLECYLTSDNENGCGNWQVTASGPTPAWGSVTQSAKICGRICEYPWPNPHAPDNDVLPFEDNIYNYSIWYCRGNEAANLLPHIQQPGDLIFQTFAASEAGVDELVKQQFFLYRDDTISDDAIGIRIYENENGKSPEEWYWKQFGLAAPEPQSLTIDGYPAVRSGRTVYVAVWNLAAGVLYSNIYLISYNENASQQTIDIYNRMLDTWEFNLNMMPSDKEKLQRDMRRLNDLNDIYDKLLDYKGANGTFPMLGGGTYISAMTTSKWPSWQDTLGAALGGNLPVDPLNSFDLPYPGPPLLCDEASGFDQNTCWDDTNNQYQCPGSIAGDSHTYIYQYLASPSGESANLYANLEYLGPDSWLNLFPPPEPCSGISNAACDCFNYQFNLTGTATDHQGPVINSVDALAGGAVNVIAGTRILDASITDAGSGVRQVEFYIDGFLKSTDGDGSDGWSWDFITTEYVDGNHTIMVRAYDNVGNWTDAVFSALVSNAGGGGTIPPFVTIVSPGVGNTISTDVAVSAQGSDNNVITSIVLELEDSASVVVWTDSCAGNVTNSMTCSKLLQWDADGNNVPDRPNANYILRAVATDSDGNTSSHEISITIDYGDIQDPAINSLEYYYILPASSLDPGTVLIGQPTIRVNATDDNAVNRVEFYVDDIFRGHGADQGGDNWDWVWDTTGLTNGTHTLIVYVYDAHGNEADQIVSVEIDNPVPDTEAPVVSFVVPPTRANGSAVDGIISTAAEATDNVKVRAVNFYVDYLLRSSMYSTNSGYCENDSSCTTEATCTANCGSTWIETYEWELNTNILTDGWHTIQVDAVDAAGNRSSSIEIRVNVRGYGGPDITYVCVGPPSGGLGTTFTFYAEVIDFEGVLIDGVKAYIQQPDEVNLEIINMPLVGGDEYNGQYEGFWPSTIEGAFYVDIQAMDVDGNVSEADNIPGQWVCGSGAAPPVCNNDGTCDAGETNANCPDDCPVACTADGGACTADGDCCSSHCYEDSCAATWCECVTLGGGACPGLGKTDCLADDSCVWSDLSLSCAAFNCPAFSGPLAPPCELRDSCSCI